MPERNTAVIGAGIAGLSAALSLAEAGLRPLVLEGQPRYAGGRISGRPPVEFDYGGRRWSFPGEHGVHGLWSQYRNLLGLLHRFGIAPGLVQAGDQEWIYASGGRVRRAEIGRRLSGGPLPAPLHYFWLLADPRFLGMLSPLDLLRVPWVVLSMSTLLALEPMREGHRMDGWTVGRFLFGWPGPFRAFAGALARSGLGTGSGDAPFAGFVALFRFYSLLRRDACLYHFLGNDPDRELVTPMVRELRRRGGELAMGHTATSLKPEAEGWRVRYESPGGPGEVRAHSVVLATDAPGARRLLLAGDETRAAAGGLRWSQGQATATVRLWFKTAPRPGGNAGMFGGAFTLDNFFWLHRIYEPFRAWNRETGGSALEAHMYGSRPLMDGADASLLSLAAWDVQRAFPELRGGLVHGTLQRNPPTHTLFNIGTTSRDLGVETPWPGVYAAGDWVRDEAPALFLERACTTGLLAANRVRALHGLPALPIQGYAPPEWPARALQAALSVPKRLVVRLAGG